LFFPEVIGFVTAVLLSPLWAARLIHRGYYVRAAIFAIAGPAAGAAFVWLLWKGRRWSAYLTMAALLLMLWWLGSSLPASALQ
jgi:hypothetical protein